MRKYRILELVITRDQTRYALHAPSRSLQESPQEGTAGTEPSGHPEMYINLRSKIPSAKYPPPQNLQQYVSYCIYTNYLYNCTVNLF